jgi:two-component system sensor histidine kinase EvgS
VLDQGMGIAVEDQPQLFAPFFRAAEARRRGIEGLGLGLSIAQRLAKALGGVLEVQSTPGKGSRFTIHLSLSASLRTPVPA